ncbi:MAG: NADP-dependent phosphogluconate dehydrogenase [Shewanella sp.]|nr:NADP-dependent phosphogluconate dehydrogenase [Shewanella sp.]
MSNQSSHMDIGVIGLGVMGKNLALNITDNGYSIAAFDLDSDKINALIEQSKEEVKIFSPEENTPRVIGCESIEYLISQLRSPKMIVLSVPAGKPVDGVCQALINAGISEDDIVIDTGNSLWTDTVEREAKYNGQFLFFSSAVSGGEVGARFGPSLMPSGSIKAWERISPVWEAIAAKVDPITGLPIERTKPGDTVEHGEPCTTYIGDAGSGHYVKMVHNGIEYADMQLICEAYHILSTGCGLSADEIGRIFERWNEGRLNSYLMEISADILQQSDPETGKPLVEMILDKAGQKGTGLWTAVSSLQIGAPAPTIAEAVSARAVSNQKPLRQQLSKKLYGPVISVLTDGDKDQVISSLEKALYCAKICCYAQGFQLMDMAASEHGWKLNFAEIAKIWRAGCIIRATFLQSITQAYQQDAELPHLLLSQNFAQELSELQNDWRTASIFAISNGIPVPCISSALSYYDSFRSHTLPANLLQGQRDFFGAHTYQRQDKPENEKFHLEWSNACRKQVRV